LPELAAGPLTGVPSVTAVTDDSRRKTPSIKGVNGRFSCVVDEHPRFHLDALRWFACLTEIAGVNPADLMVHVVGSESSEVLWYLKSQGVTVRMIDRFDPRSPHCNKIAGALRLADDPIDGVTVLCDTDLAVLEDPRQLVLSADAVAAKPVDAPVPPLEVLVAIFDAAALDAPPAVKLPWGLEYTVSGNNNGGLYLVPGPLLPRVASAWARWARWLLDRSELLHEWTIYVDQVAMALGLAAEGIGSTPLDVRWNTPSHDLTRIPNDAPEPAIIHYHQEVVDEGLLRLTGSGSIDGQIRRANEAIGRVWGRAHPSHSHRKWLRLIDRPSIVENAERDDRAIVSELIEALRPASVLEVGGADRGVTAGIHFERYSAIDESVEALRQAEAARPDGQFLNGTLAQFPINADLIICLDSLDRRADQGVREQLVHDLWRSANKALVISGAGDGALPRHHELLSRTLRRVAPDAEVYPVGGDRHATFVVLRPPAERHPRDFLPATLDPLTARHPDPLTLAAIRIHAWRTLTFYPDHAPRLWEYPVVAQLISDELPQGSRLLDIGAGTTPLAPFLTSRGFVVDTVDPSPRRREWPPEDDWNEWDFLDYHQAGLAHRSWNCTVDKLPLRTRYDGTYSVSVIEHIPAVDRRAMLAEISSRTRDGGLVVLTIDLARGRDDLWNRNLGLEVEDPSSHGTLADVVEEGARVGLEVIRREIVRDWGNTNVDIALLALRQTGAARPKGWRHVGRVLRSMRGPWT
jgi:hypothetical protein